MIRLSGATTKINGKQQPPPPLEAVKVEAEDPVEEEHGPVHKRSKLFLTPSEQWSSSSGSAISTSPMGYTNVLEEPSPLGLRLNKSASFLELLQMKLSNGNSNSPCIEKQDLKKKDVKSASGFSVGEKMKASNFSASSLKIGNWESISKYEGDLVAKCYYAKQKLVWEVLDGGLKSKIEIQWSDITALMATFPENGPGVLDVVLSRAPQFYKETNPQPRKHTLWQSTSDFTGGQASQHRRHVLRCQHGLLNKHFEKLIQCDPRLNSLSRQPEVILESPYFQPRSAPEDQDERKCHVHDNLNNGGPIFPGFLHEPLSPCATSQTSRSGLMDSITGMSDLMSQEIHSPNSSVTDTRATEENLGGETSVLRHRSYIDHMGFPSSMSVQDLVNHMEHCISEAPNVNMPSKGVLEQMAQHLLDDSPAESSEGLMSRVNSLYTLLAKDIETSHPQDHAGPHRGLEHDYSNSAPALKSEQPVFEFAPEQPESNEVSSYRQAPCMSRKDSYGDFLMNLPRIASLPQFYPNIHDDGGNQAR